MLYKDDWNVSVFAKTSKSYWIKEFYPANQMFGIPNICYNAYQQMVANCFPPLAVGM